MRSFLRIVYHRLCHPPPRGMKQIGKNSVFFPPRRIDGAHSISIGENTFIFPHGWLSAIQEWAGIIYDPKIIIGDNVHIGGNVWITALSKVVIEDDCVLGERVYISDAAHGLDPKAGPIMKQKLISKGDVHIQSGTFIGYGACVQPGVTLGRHCVVGINSVVTHSFPDYSMIAGSPARLIKVYSEQRGAWISAAESENER